MSSMDIFVVLSALLTLLPPILSIRENFKKKNQPYTFNSSIAATMFLMMPLLCVALFFGTADKVTRHMGTFVGLTFYIASILWALSFITGVARGAIVEETGKS